MFLKRRLPQGRRTLPASTACWFGAVRGGEDTPAALCQRDGRFPADPRRRSGDEHSSHAIAPSVRGPLPFCLNNDRRPQASVAQRAVGESGGL